MQKFILRNFLRSLILPLNEIDEILPQSGKIFDLGCGEGVISKYLAQNKKRIIIGVDSDGKRLPKSTQKNLTFKMSDIRKYNIKNADVVIISDVLHHISFKDQEKVLKNVTRGLRKGGLLVIKEIDTQEFLRSAMSRFWDFIFYPKEKIYFNNAKELKTKLTGLGFNVKVKRTTRFFPGSTTLFIARK